MRNFLLSSTLILLIACSPNRLTKSSDDTEIVLSSSTFSNPFVNGFKSYFFKIQSDIYGQYLSGLLLIKPISNNNNRIIFTTEVGLKLFDFEFIGEQFTVHYCIDKLNRKPVLKILEKDFRMLLMIGLTGKKVREKPEDSHIVYYWKDNKEFFYYFVNKDSNKVEKIVTTSDKGKPKVHVIMTEYIKDFPNNIEIVHDNINLKIALKFIER